MHSKQESKNRKYISCRCDDSTEWQQYLCLQLNVAAQNSKFPCVFVCPYIYIYFTLFIYIYIYIYIYIV